MEIAFNHCFAEHDARLDDALNALRREQRDGQGRRQRNAAKRATRQIEGLAYSLPSNVPLALEDEAGSPQLLSPYFSFLAAVRRTSHLLTPVAEAIRASFNAAQERRVVLQLLAAHLTYAASAVSKSAFLLWAFAQLTWDAIRARLPLRRPIRKPHGFFGADKVDGRNSP